MTTCHKSFLEKRCAERGYTLDEVMPCVVSQDGDDWTIDTESEFYPRHPKPGFETTVGVPSPEFLQKNTSGPGTELSALLERFGISSTPTCKCREMSAKMNAWGVDECSKPERISEVVDVMREEAKARRLPFVDIAARLLVKRAIANARRKAAADAQRPPHHDRWEEVAPPVHETEG